MAFQATYIGVAPLTQIPTAVALALGVRVIRDASGLVAVAAASVRGDFTTLQTAEASVPCNVASMLGGGIVPALASEAATAGDLAYSAASGKYSVTSASAVVVGRWQETTASGAIGLVQLFSNPAA